MKKISFILLLILISFSVIACSSSDPVKVTFKDYDGTVLHVITVEDSDDFSLPTDPVRLGYFFSGWVGNDFTDFSEDFTVHASYTQTDLSEMVYQVKNSTNFTVKVKVYIDNVFSREIIHNYADSSIASTLIYPTGPNDYLYTTQSDDDYFGFEYNHDNACWFPFELNASQHANIKYDLLQYQFVATVFDMSWFTVSDENIYTLRTAYFNNLIASNPTFGNFSAYQYTLHDDAIDISIVTVQPGVGNVKYELTYQDFNMTEASTQAPKDVSEICSVN